jgi:hypothetical protein
MTDEQPQPDDLPLRAALSCCFANLTRLIALDGLLAGVWLVALALAFVVPDLLQAPVAVLAAAPAWLAVATICASLSAERSAPALLATLRQSMAPALLLTLPCAVSLGLLTLSVNSVRAAGGAGHAGVVLVASLAANGVAALTAVVLTPLAMAVAAVGERGLRRSFLLAAAVAARRPLAVLGGVAFVVVLGQLTAWVGPLVLVLFPAPVALLVQFGVGALLGVDHHSKDGNA